MTEREVVALERIADALEGLNRLADLALKYGDAMPEECARKKCSYYQHYLAYGPADLTHEGFHAAEERCRDAQLRIESWMQGHPKGEIPESLMRTASNWEARVRA